MIQILRIFLEKKQISSTERLANKKLKQSQNKQNKQKVIKHLPLYSRLIEMVVLIPLLLIILLYQ